MTDPLDSGLLQLQQEYLDAMPLRLSELRADIIAMGQRAPEAARSVRDRLHRLAGSGGSFGFVELSAIAREGERWLAANPGSLDSERLTALVDRLEAVVSAADAQLATAHTGERPAVIPRALVIMRPTPQRDRIGQELRSAGYQVGFAGPEDDPASIPTEQLPHLVIIGGEAGDGDLSAVASAWTSNPERRPGAVVLVETLRPVDRLRAIAA